MTTGQYYASLKRLAREKRQAHSVCTNAFGLREMRAIYRAEGIHIDQWPYPMRRIRAAYLLEHGKPHVLLNGKMPIEPRLFSLAHELKHHYVDSAAHPHRKFDCFPGANPRSDLVEIGAEVFAAEFIYPEHEFLAWVRSTLGHNPCTAETVVHLKRACEAHISYTFLTKRLERLGVVAPGAFAKVRFKKLEEELFGLPPYRRSYLARRTRQSA